MKLPAMAYPSISTAILSRGPRFPRVRRHARIVFSRGPRSFRARRHARIVPFLPAPALAAPALAAALVLCALLPAGGEAEVLAVDPLGAATPVLWNGGVAWQDVRGVLAATPGSAPRRLVSFRPLGFTYAFSLDSGAGSAAEGGTGGGSGPGVLAYGWEEANNMTPPMGPGDTSVPTPPLPYETSISHRGLIDATGHATPLPTCAAQDEPTAFGAYLVSLAATAVAYLCPGVPPGGPPPAPAVLSSYLAFSPISAPATTTQTIASSSAPFQASGDFLAYTTGSTTGPRHVVVFDRATATVSYELPLSSTDYLAALALQADGTLVVLGAGTSPCPKAALYASQSFPAEYLSPASPTPHQLGCFYGGALRPVAGQWVALAPGPGAHDASLVLLTLATGATRTLATFPTAAIAEPQPQALPPSSQFGALADFDGHRLAWIQHTCAGAAIELVPDIATMTPPPVPSARCPVVFHIHGSLRPNRSGVLRVRLACPLGCTVTELRISGPRPLLTESSTFFSLPPSPTPVTHSLRLSPRARAYLRRHRHARVLLSALTAGFGIAPGTKTTVHVTLAR